MVNLNLGHGDEVKGKEWHFASFTFFTLSSLSGRKC